MLTEANAVTDATSLTVLNPSDFGGFHWSLSCLNATVYHFSMVFVVEFDGREVFLSPNKK